MKKILLFSIPLLALVAFYNLPNHYLSKKPICVNIEEAFQNTKPDSPSYEKLIVQTLKQTSPKDYRYFFETFFEENNKIYMTVNLRNENNCFDANILVDKWNKLAGMKRTNGVSYPKELYNLKWEIKELEGREEIVYIDMHNIID